LYSKIATTQPKNAVDYVELSLDGHHGKASANCKADKDQDGIKASVIIREPRF
jgi:hypothetical protein